MNSLRDRKAINVGKDFHEYYENLKFSTGNSVVDTPFKDFREMYIISAVIGVKNEAFEKIEGSKVKIFDSNVFNEHKDIPLLLTIAYCKEKKPELLADDEYVLRIVEGYANGGLPLLISAIQNGESNNLLNLSLYLEEILDV